MIKLKVYYIFHSVWFPNELMIDKNTSVKCANLRYFLGIDGLLFCLSVEMTPENKSLLFLLADTFASKVAAIQDDHADNSVGNVTGSNAVNVFLGIGIAWSMAAIYWTAKGEQFLVKPGRSVLLVLQLCPNLGEWANFYLTFNFQYFYFKLGFRIAIKSIIH